MVPPWLPRQPSASPRCSCLGLPSLQRCNTGIICVKAERVSFCHTSSLSNVTQGYSVVNLYPGKRVKVDRLIVCNSNQYPGKVDRMKICNLIDQLYIVLFEGPHILQGILDCLTGPCVTVSGVGRIQGTKQSTQFSGRSPQQPTKFGINLVLGIFTPSFQFRSARRLEGSTDSSPHDRRDPSTMAKTLMTPPT